MAETKQPIECILNGSVSSGGAADAGGKVDKDDKSRWFTLGRNASGIYYNPKGSPSQDQGATTGYVDKKIEDHDVNPDAHKELFDEVRVEVLDADPETPEVNEPWINTTEDLYLPGNQVTSFNGRINNVTPQPRDYTPEFIGAARKNHSTEHGIYGNDPITPEMIGAGRVNPNLLDNWYFIGGGTEGKFPINQREIGISEKNPWITEYGLDRWKITGNKEVILMENGLKIICKTRWGALVENIDNFPKNTEMTFSVLAKDVTSNNYQLVVDDTKGGTIKTKVLVNGVTSLTFNSGSIDKLATFIQLYTTNTTASFTIIAAKLEIGSQQTLAHKERNNWILNEIPNYGEELRKCQRYLRPLSYAYIFPRSETSIVAYTRFDTPMANDPNDVFFMKPNTSIIVWSGEQDRAITAATPTFGLNNVSKNGVRFITIEGFPEKSFTNRAMPLHWDSDPNIFLSAEI